MVEGLTRRNGDSLCSAVLPGSCSRSLWRSHLVLLRRANPPETTRARFAEGTPSSFVPVAFSSSSGLQIPKGLILSPRGWAVSFAPRWHTGLDDLRDALRAREPSPSSSWSHTGATGTDEGTQLCTRSVSVSMKQDRA